MSETSAPEIGGFTPRARLLTILLNYIPFFQLSTLIGVAVWCPVNPTARLVASLAWLYLAPPTCYRLLCRIAPSVAQRTRVGSRDFLIWWAGHQLQVVFCRFSFAEELLRLVPGLYSQWLRLWGSKIGANVYWTAGVTITDRAWLEIGDCVTFGAGVKLNAHVIALGADGTRELILARISIGGGSQIGGYSLLTAGTSVAPGSVTRALLTAPPFSHWKSNERIRNLHAS